MSRLSRRQLVRNGVVTAGGLLLADLEQISTVFAAPVKQKGGLGEGKRVEILEFLDEGRAPTNVAFNEELDGRLYTDLSDLNPNDAVTPTSKFYIRTRPSKLLPNPKAWNVRINGLVENPATLKLEELKTNSRSAGIHLMECSGNSRFAHFGMLSVAKWSGMPMAEILERVKANAGATRVLISGFDQYETKSASSVPGASWIFLLEQLRSTGAFLATDMNGLPLTLDHGAPVRLVVPGWYGCTCIKWVDTITLVDDRAEATSQMQEYAARTQQNGVPALARDYQPAAIEQAAMPIRVEKWLVSGKIEYRLVGILWGGFQRIKELAIRFNPGEDYMPVGQFQHAPNDPWSFWTHTWTPKSPGRYAIQLAVNEPKIRARRLDSGYYVREVQIKQV